MNHDDVCECAACIDARIDEVHDGVMDKLEKACELEDRKRLERQERVRQRRESRVEGMAREVDGNAPSVADLGSMFKAD